MTREELLRHPYKFWLSSSHVRVRRIETASAGGRPNHYKIRLINECQIGWRAVDCRVLPAFALIWLTDFLRLVHFLLLDMR